MCLLVIFILFTTNYMFMLYVYFLYRFSYHPQWLISEHLYIKNINPCLPYQLSVFFLLVYSLSFFYIGFWNFLYRWAIMFFFVLQGFKIRKIISSLQIRYIITHYFFSLCLHFNTYPDSSRTYFSVSCKVTTVIFFSNHLLL